MSEHFRSGDVVWANGKAWMFVNVAKCGCCARWVAHDEEDYSFYALDEFLRAKDFRWLVKNGKIVPFSDNSPAHSVLYRGNFRWNP